MSASTSVLLVICCTMVAGSCTSVMITWLGLGARVSARARAKARVRVRARARVRVRGKGWGSLVRLRGQMLGVRCQGQGLGVWG